MAKYTLLFNIFYATYFGLLGLFTYAYFLGDPRGRGFGGWAYRTIFTTIPELYLRIIDTFFGRRGHSVTMDCWDYCINQRNPLVQILYLALVNGAFFGWLFAGDPLLEDAYLVQSRVHSWLGYIGISLCQISFFVACRNEPHKLTPENISRYKSDEPFDKLLYLENSYCTTCKIFRPPRSKHCTLCNICVAHFDHHCIWLNQCVSYKNLNTFMIFLLIHVIFLTYASTIVALILLSDIYKDKLMERTFYNASTLESHKASYYVVFRYIFSKHQTLFYIFCLISVLALSFICFFIYHFSLIYRGTTTNETYKWAHVDKVYNHLKRIGVSVYPNPSPHSKPISKSTDSSNADAPQTKSEKVGEDSNFDSRSVGCIPSGIASEQPAEGENDTRLNNNSNSLHNSSTGDSDVDHFENEDVIHRNMILKNEFERVSHYKHVIRYVIDNEQFPMLSEVEVGEYPRNIYHRGVLGNFKQALVGYDRISGDSSIGNANEIGKPNEKRINKGKQSSKSGGAKSSANKHE